MNANLSGAVTRAIDELDAAMFSGDEFVDPRRRQVMKEYVARWTRRIEALDRLDLEEEKPQ